MSLRKLANNAIANLEIVGSETKKLAQRTIYAICYSREIEHTTEIHRIAIAQLEKSIQKLNANTPLVTSEEFTELLKLTRELTFALDHIDYQADQLASFTSESRASSNTIDKDLSDLLTHTESISLESDFISKLDAFAPAIRKNYLTIYQADPGEVTLPNTKEMVKLINAIDSIVKIASTEYCHIHVGDMGGFTADLQEQVRSAMGTYDKMVSSNLSTNNKLLSIKTSLANMEDVIHQNIKDNDSHKNKVIISHDVNLMNEEAARKMSNCIEDLKVESDVMIQRIKAIKSDLTMSSESNDYQP